MVGPNYPPFDELFHLLYLTISIFIITSTITVATVIIITLSSPSLIGRVPKSTPTSDIMDTSAFKFLYGNEGQLLVHRKGMLQVCWIGDLSQLQQTYHAHNIQPGAKLDWMEIDDRPPTVLKLFVTTIIHEHAPIVCYLFSMHPREDLKYKLVVQAIINHPNMEITELVCEH